MSCENSSKLLSIEGLSVHISGRKILDNINLAVYPGKVLTVIGPNGAGKSTLLRASLGLLKNYTGKINLADQIKIGYMPQKVHIDELMPITVDRFLHLHHGLRKKKPLSADKGFYEHILNELKIMGLISSPLKSISGGELQRVLLARALLNRPELLILDEPAQGVDISGQVELYQLIKQVCQEFSCGLLMVSHDLHLVMADTDEVICLNKHICCSGHPESVSKHPEFLDLFGKTEAGQFALYTHKHNHKHDLDGEVIND